MVELSKKAILGFFIDKLIDKGVLDKGHDDELIRELGSLFDEPESAADLHKRIAELETTVAALTTPVPLSEPPPPYEPPPIDP